MMDQTTDSAIAVLQQQAKQSEQQFTRIDHRMDQLFVEIHRINAKLHWVIGAVTFLVAIQLPVVRQLFGS